MDELHAQIVTLQAVKTGGDLMTHLKDKMKDISDRVQKTTIALVDQEEKIMLARVQFQDTLAELTLPDAMARQRPHRVAVTKTLKRVLASAHAAALPRVVLVVAACRVWRRRRRRSTPSRSTSTTARAATRSGSPASTSTGTADATFCGINDATFR